MPPGAGDNEYLDWIHGDLAAALRAFEPQFLLVSAGFDGHADDPLAQHEVSSAGYGLIAGALADLAGELCAGRLVSLLEGGYHPRALPESVKAYLAEMIRPSGNPEA